MRHAIRTPAFLPILLAGLCGCQAVQPVTASIERATARIFHPGRNMAPAAPPSPALDAYKTDVAYQVMRHNPSHLFSGRLPPMLPAIVVLSITVEEDGQLREVAVQRSRDDAASRIAIDAVRRSAPLPRPARPLAGRDGALTFSETFLFNDAYRFQIRSVAGVQ